MLSGTSTNKNVVTSTALHTNIDYNLLSQTAVQHRAQRTNPNPFRPQTKD